MSFIKVAPYVSISFLGWIGTDPDQGFKKAQKIYFFDQKLQFTSGGQFDNANR